MSIGDRNPFRSSGFVPVMPVMYRLGVESEGIVRLIPDCNGRTCRIEREEVLSAAECANVLRGQPFIALRVSEELCERGDTFSRVHVFHRFTCGEFVDRVGSEGIPYLATPVASFESGAETITTHGGGEESVPFYPGVVCWHSTAFTTILYVGSEAVGKLLFQIFLPVECEWIPDNLDLVLMALRFAEMTDIARACPTVATYVMKPYNAATEQINEAIGKVARIREELAAAEQSLAARRNEAVLYEEFFAVGTS